MNLIGQKFKRLTLIEVDQSRKGRTFWLCRCDCGNIKSISQTSITTGKTGSCGCLASEALAARSRTHGLSKHPLYGMWSGMLSRCRNPKHAAYKHYGGRGIAVCDRWLSFDKFHEDMAQSFVAGMEIERIDNSLGYFKGNCKWATRTEQANNTRRNARLAKDGRTQTIAQWSREIGVGKSTLWARLNVLGWSIRQTLTIPPMRLDDVQKSHQMQSLRLPRTHAGL